MPYVNSERGGMKMGQMRETMQARWNEPCIFEMGRKGTRGHLVPRVEDKIKASTRGISSHIPKSLRRKSPPNLPELSEIEVMRHFLRLSQESTCVDSGFNGEGTCTMKYNPKVNEALAGSSKVANLHPLQDTKTAQGMLEIVYRLGECLIHLSGMDAVTFQPPSGTICEWTECLLIAAYHKSRGNLEKKRDLFVPYTSHGTNAVGAKMAGFNVVTLPQTESGNLDLDALKATLSDRTAGMIQTNPTSLSVFDSNMMKMADLIHEAGGVFAYDAANTNCIMGKVNARDLKADIVHYNLHKAFGSPHGGYGPGAGVLLCTKEFEKFLPVPRIEFDGKKYFLNYSAPHSIGRVKEFYGNVPNAIRAYAWLLAMGTPGILLSSELATLNNNYLMEKIKGTKGIDIPMGEGRRRMEETVYSFKKMREETGVQAANVALRICDFGMNSTFAFGYPLYVEEPWVVEPTESMDIDEMDKFIQVVKQVAEEAYLKPDLVQTAPHCTTVGRVDFAKTENPETMALTWRMYKKKGLSF
jgi:glycine dehydrogenase subunit 2